MKLLRVFEGYLAREIYAAVAVVLLAFLLLFAFFDLVHELQDLGKGGYQLAHAVGYVLLTLPGRLYELLPIGVLIGTLYALTGLARHSEITVLRASGLATRGFLVALIKIGLPFVMLTLLLGEVVAPPAERAAQEMRLRSTSSVVAQDFRSGAWIKDDHSFINVELVLPDGGLRGVKIYAFAADWALQSISLAEKGEYLPSGEWRLSNVLTTRLDSAQASVERQADWIWRSALTPEILSVLLVVPERMSLPQLVRYIGHLEDNHQRTQRYEIAVWKKLVYPLASLVMMALALPFAYLQHRMGGVSVKLFLGIMLGITFHMLNGLLSSLGIINDWPPLMSALAPAMLFLLLTAGMLWSVDRR